MEPRPVSKAERMPLREGAAERTRQEIRRHARLAAEALTALPPSEARDALAELALHETRRAS